MTIEGIDYVIGAEVISEDEMACGQLERVVVDPIARRVTHLVVAPKHHLALARLVPVGDVTSASPGLIRLGCSLEQFDELEAAEETQFLSGAEGQWAYEQSQILSLPYFGLGVGGVGAGVGVGDIGMPGWGELAAPMSVTYEKVPAGEVQVRRGQHVHAKDGEIGRVRGLVVDPNDHHVTHVLLAEGHLFGHKEVAIPISAVATVENGVQLTMTKAEIKDLPPVRLESDA